jgi:PIN domain nuclease of toxin-antitoxin system
MILDTCALLFLPSGDPRLSRQTRDKLARETTVWFCAISAFEIALKVRDGKLDLPMEPQRWIRSVAERYRLTEVPLDSGLCAAAALLPLIHRDPCDRFIIAAAKRLHAPIVTIDPKFRDYGVETIC